MNEGYEDCPEGKTCPHARAFMYALGYFSTESSDDIRIPAVLTERYRESLRRQGVIR